MDYIETANLISDSLLRDIAILASILIPSLIGIWNLTHSKATSAAVTPNHVTSMFDAVKRIVGELSEVKENQAQLREQVEAHLITDVPCQCSAGGH